MLLLALLLAAGSVSGKVTIAGLAPKLANLPVTRDIKICGTNKPDESLVIGAGGGIKDAVVWVTDLPNAPPPKKEARKPRLDQETCTFQPHVLAAQVGTTIEVVNSDSVLHNARAAAGGGKNLFNYAMPIKNYSIPTKLKEQGFFKVSCDVHPWMRAWIAALPNTAFALTKDDGTYKIENVPPGKHHVKLWHERLGEREGDVEVPADGSGTFDVTLNPR